MATDIAQIVRNLHEFHDLAGQTVISVGAGGGQLLEYSRRARRVLAVDRDEAALGQLRAAVAAKGLAGIIEPVLADFLVCDTPADVVLFEFSLHEMDDPAQALAHARALAPTVVVFDHWTDSPWAWQVLEEEKVARSTAAVLQAGPSRQVVHHTEQRFPDYAALMARISSQGPETAVRAERYRHDAPIVIPMAYWLALLIRPRGGGA